MTKIKIPVDGMSTPEEALPADAPRYTPVQVHRMCALSVPGGGVITAFGDDLKIRPWENAPSQRWKIKASNGAYSFRNMSSGKLFGVNIWECFSGYAQEINDWEKFSLESVEGGFRFKVHFKNQECFLVRHSLKDFYQISNDENHFTPLDITYLSG
jgi:hypothetical protein